MKIHLTQSLRRGWHSTRQMPLIVSLLFMYHIIWGIWLFRIFTKVTSPALVRMPDHESPLFHMFAAESEFHLMKTDAVWPYVGALGLLLLLRAMLAPLWNAGVLNTIHEAPSSIKGEWKAFYQGIRNYALFFGLIGIIQALLAVLPLFGLCPYLYAQLQQAGDLQLWLKQAVWWIAAYAVYLALLRMLVYVLWFARLHNSGWRECLRSWQHSMLRFVLAALPMACLIGLVSFISQSVLGSVSFIEAGLLALILYHGVMFVRLWCKLWECGSLYACWRNRSIKLY